MGIFPTTAVADITGGVLDVLTDNMGVIVGVLAFALGIKWVTRFFNKSTKGRV